MKLLNYIRHSKQISNSTVSKFKSIFQEGKIFHHFVNATIQLSVVAFSRFYAVNNQYSTNVIKIKANLNVEHSNMDILNFDQCSRSGMSLSEESGPDGNLDKTEFTSICRALFRNDRGHIYNIEEKQIDEIFTIFDLNKDGKIDKKEFVFCWDNWIKKIVRPVSVFLIVDVQNDFISGSLNISHCSAKQDGAEVIEPINKLLTTVKFDAVFYSLDWHPSDHVSFIDNLPKRKLHESSPVSAEDAQTYDTVIFEGPPLMKQRLWPRHCVQDSWGAELHKELKVLDNSIKIYKGTNPEVDSYSVFWDNKKLADTTLVSELKQRNATDIYICGLAYDVCVGATAADSLAIGYRTVLIDDCCRGVDLVDIEKTKNTVTSNNGVIVDSSQVKGMVEGRDRRPELGYKLALELKNTLKNKDNN